MGGRTKSRGSGERQQRSGGRQESHDETAGSPRPRSRSEREAAIRFIKSHGLGNDYLVLCSGESLDPESVIRICHRHEGLGSDGILEPVSVSGGRYRMRIWNPDTPIWAKTTKRGLPAINCGLC